MKFEQFATAKMVDRSFFQDGDFEYQIDGEELTMHFGGQYSIAEVEYKLAALREANSIFKKVRKFPFPKFVDGRPVTTELRFNALGNKIYLAIAWSKEGDRNWFPDCKQIYTIWESDDLWTLREIFQYQEPKHNPKSLCY